MRKRAGILGIVSLAWLAGAEKAAEKGGIWAKSMESIPPGLTATFIPSD